MSEEIPQPVRWLTISLLFLFPVLALCPEYRENTSTEIRVPQHTTALWIKLAHHPLYILQQ
jgi:hypothetical protein